MNIDNLVYEDMVELDGEIYINNVMNDYLKVLINGEYVKIGGSINVKSNDKRNSGFTAYFQTGTGSVSFHPVYLRKAKPETIAKEITSEGYIFVPGMKKYIGKYVQGMTHKVQH